MSDVTNQAPKCAGCGESERMIPEIPQGDEIERWRCLACHPPTKITPLLQPQSPLLSPQEQMDVEAGRQDAHLAISTQRRVVVVIPQWKRDDTAPGGYVLCGVNVQGLGCGPTEMRLCRQMLIQALSNIN